MKVSVFFSRFGAKHAPLRLTKGQPERRGGPDVTVVTPYAAALFGADTAFCDKERPRIGGEEGGRGMGGDNATFPPSF